MFAAHRIVFRLAFLQVIRALSLPKVRRWWLGQASHATLHTTSCSSPGKQTVKTIRHHDNFFDCNKHWSVEWLVSLPVCWLVLGEAQNSSYLTVWCSSLLCAGPNKFAISTGELILARWRDSRWYVAQVVRPSSRKTFITYLDGDHTAVPFHHMLPLVCVFLMCACAHVQNIILVEYAVLTRLFFF